MTEEERRAQSHTAGDTPSGPSIDQLAHSPELHAMSKEDRKRAMDIGQRLHQFATQNPDSPDGQRAAQMVSRIKEKLTEGDRQPVEAPDIASGPEVGARNFADAATFGLSNKIADSATKYLEPQADMEAVHRSNDRENRAHSGSAALGQVAGFAAPFGGPGLLFKAARAATAPLAAGAEAGLGARIGLGALRGGAETALALPASGGLRGAIESDAPTLRGRFEAAGKGALDEAKNLGVTAPIGGLLGAASAAAQGLRFGHSQTGRDIRTVEDVGKGTVNPLRGGGRGGYFDSEVLKGAHSDSDVGEVARRAGDRIRKGLNEDFSQAGQEYATARTDAANSGALARDVDVYDLYKKAIDLAQSHRTTNATKRLLEAEVIEPLSAHIGTGMKLQDFNDFRGKLGDLAEPPAIGSTPESRQFGDLAADARGVVKNTALGEVNTRYAERMDKLEQGHQRLGFRNRTHTDIEDPVAAKRAANFVAREGQTSVTSGIQDQDAKELLKLYPQFEQELAAPELLRAAQRLKLGLGHTGGGLHHIAGGLISHNIEPALAAAYRLGKPLNNLNPLLQAAIRAMGGEGATE